MSKANNKTVDAHLHVVSGGELSHAVCHGHHSSVPQNAQKQRIIQMGHHWPPVSQQVLQVTGVWGDRCKGTAPVKANQGTGVWGDRCKGTAPVKANQGTGVWGDRCKGTAPVKANQGTGVWGDRCKDTAPVKANQGTKSPK